VTARGEQLDLRLLRTLVVVAETGSFTAAAAFLGQSQPAVSQQVRRLESAVGVPLLLRLSQGVTLAPAGEALVSTGRPILEAAGRALDAARRRAAGSEPLRVGFVPGIPQLVLGLLLGERGTPGESPVSLHRIEWAEEIDELRAGRCDMALVQLPVPLDQMGYEPLLLLPRVAAFSSSHPLGGRSSVSIAELADEPILDAASNRAFWLADPRPDGRPAQIVGPPASTAEEMLASVAAGRGMALTSWGVAESHSRRDVRFVPVTDIEPVVLIAAWPQEGAALGIPELVAYLRAALADTALPAGTRLAPDVTAA
jgi:DNA-binding transcriptional LysR family regulator